MLGVTGQLVWNERARLIDDIARFLDLRRSPPFSAGATSVDGEPDA